jgi:hypothetical protein
LARAECPYSIDSIPVLYNDTTFRCAYRYMGKGSDEEIQACMHCDGSSSMSSQYDGMELSR